MYEDKHALKGTLLSLLDKSAEISRTNSRIFARMKSPNDSRPARNDEMQRFDTDVGVYETETKLTNRANNESHRRERKNVAVMVKEDPPPVNSEEFQQFLETTQTQFTRMDKERRDYEMKLYCRPHQRHCNPSH